MIIFNIDAYKKNRVVPYHAVSCCALPSRSMSCRIVSCHVHVNDPKYLFTYKRQSLDLIISYFPISTQYFCIVYV